MRFPSIIFMIALLAPFFGCRKTSDAVSQVPPSVMEQVYKEVKTPYKYGLVVVPTSRDKMVDSPSVFKQDGSWHMIYIVYDGTGYETWLAHSDDLLTWETSGRLMSFTENTWDARQKAGYIALQDHEWGGSYEVEAYDNKYWMSYLGGETE